jgi:lipopolysaccharide/colanic/teichoic acid biosynthesis glycosyltransferase
LATKIEHIREATLIPSLHLATTDELYMLSKRLLDVLLALALIVLLAPLMAVIAIAIKLDSRGPVIFKQRRVLGDQSLGDDQEPGERTFEFFKFRTMVHKADQSLHQKYVENLINGNGKQCEENGQKLYKLTRDPRITQMGRWLRRTSLDELPQLLNILRGDMTFVGPRPAIPYEVKQYKPWHMYRLTVTQGLTGLWQVMGRNELSFDAMVQLDIEYVRRRSLALDIKILLATIPAVLLRRGVC